MNATKASSSSTMDMDWDDLRLFATIADTATVRRAAAVLGVHPSTVTRRLEHFESQLGAKLFTRSSGGMRITPAGQAARRRVAEIARRIDAFEHEISGLDQRLVGTIRLAIPEALAVAFLMQALQRFRARYPDLELQFVADSDADVILALTGAPDENWVGRRVSRCAFCVYAKRHHEDAPRDIVAAEGLGLRLAAVRAGLSTLRLPCCLGDQYPELVRVEEPDPAGAEDLWMLVHPDLRSTARVRHFVDFVTDVIARHENALLGVG
ncbi:MAG: LysR family transcriptional regulator [Gammaproteobacteria bacterium]|nr:LysR family transcriptional regulator [Gammaproteobacteria bacterium]